MQIKLWNWLFVVLSVVPFGHLWPCCTPWPKTPGENRSPGLFVRFRISSPRLIYLWRGPGSGRGLEPAASCYFFLSSERSCFRVLPEPDKQKSFLLPRPWFHSDSCWRKTIEVRQTWRYVHLKKWFPVSQTARRRRFQSRFLWFFARLVYSA